MPASAVRDLRSIPQTKRSVLPKGELAPFIWPIHLASGDEARTGWAQLLRTGAFYDPRYGDFTIARNDLATMLGNFKEKYPQNPTRLPIDFNHGTSRPATPEEGKAAGWIVDCELRANGDELWGRVEWTEQAAAMITAREYQFVSATFSFDYTNSNGGEEIGPTLLAAAVTNRPVVHGMQPLALAQKGALRLSDAPEEAAEDEATEGLFSYDEQRRRVQAALATAYGAYADCYGGVYLEALFDDYAVYCEYDGGKYRVGYALDADGSVTFTSTPVELRVSYEPLSADAEEQTMSTIKVKDAAGKDIELSQETVLELAKTHAPAPVAEPVELAALKQTLESQGSKITELQQANEKLELAARTRDAEAEFDALFRAGKVDAKEKPMLMKLALSDKALFTEMTAVRPVIREVGTEHGSSGDLTASTASATMDLAVKAERDADPKLTKEQAYVKALEKNPSLYTG